ncbi:MAG: stage II sporulation protein M [archaeon]
MVLESLLSAKVAEENPLYDFGYGVALSLVSLAAGYFLFPAISSLLSVVLLSIGIVPVLMKIFYYEEGKRALFETHLKALRFFLVFFLAVSLTFGTLNYFLPKLGFASVSERLFSEEAREISSITATFQSGQFFSGIFQNPTILTIVKNNLIVLFSSFVLALVFGGGAAFILVWNAAVFGIFLSIAADKGMGVLIFSLIYALPELVSYYIGGLSGGILSAEFSSVFTKRKRKLSVALVVNSALLILVAAVLIVLMGILEGFLISP